MRPDAYRPFGEEDATDAQSQRELEDKYVMKFAGVADRIGHPVPGDHPTLRAPNGRVLPATEFPAIETQYIHALAQHYGVPTRLLDWTSNPLVSCYFAARGFLNAKKSNAQAENPEPAAFAIWCLHRDFVHNFALNWDPRVLVVTAPRASNANLHAQAGLFSLVQPTSDETGKLHLLPTIRDLVEKEARSADQVWHLLFPVLRKYVIPGDQAGLLLKLLELHGVSAATIYPGLQGAVESMKELTLHQLAPPWTPP